MLVKFHSSTSGEILMFADVARQVVACIGKEPLAKGVITFEELPEAIGRISAAIARAKAEPEPGAPAETDRPDEDLPKISLAQRFVPLLQLLQRTLGNEGYVLWEAPGDFGNSA